MKKHLLFLLMLLPMMAWADDSGTCGTNVTWTYAEATQTLTISGSGKMKDYVILASTSTPWYQYRTDIQKAIIDEGVTNIGNYTFYGFSNLTSVSIPSTVTAIGSAAFWQCSSLTSVDIPGSVTSIGNYAFFGSGLTSVVVPEGVTSIAVSAFQSCSSLTSVDIPNSVTSIGNSAFAQCSSLTSVEIPNEVSTIGDYTFQGCKSLTSVVIPNSVTSIGKYAFAQCSKLTSVEISDGVTSIGDYTFQSCSRLTSATIPNGVTSIGKGAFSNCYSMTSITIPNSVTSIGETAFNGCSKLNDVKLPDNLTVINKQTFKYCEGLKEITIPANVGEIGQEAFSRCKFESVKVLAETPPTATDDAFSNYNIPLYVPEASAAAYQSTTPWSKFSSYKTLTGEDINTDKCATPTISYSNGKLTFSCETEDAVCHSTITDTDIASYESNEVQLRVTYNISVYATKASYANSDTATATLCWIDVEPKTEGIATSMAKVKAQAVLIQSSNGVVTVSGVDDGSTVSAYSVSGQSLGSAKASGNQAALSTNLRQGEIAIVKIGDKAVKIVMR